MTCQIKSFFTAMAAAFLGLAILTGCTASHYRKSADKDVYSIIQSAEKEVFGRTNVFDISTPYSGRNPKEIPSTEILNDRMREGARMLSLEDALNMSVTNSRTYQAQKERLYLTALTLTGNRHEFRPNWFGRSSVDGDRLSNGERLGSVRSSAGFSQTLMTGGTIGASIANDLLRYYTGDPRRSAVTTISVNLLQPVLRGFGKNHPSVEALTQAERNVIYAVRDFSYFQNSFAIDVVADYFSLLAQKDVVRNRYTNYLSRVQATERLVARSQDRESASGVDQARQAELTSKNAYVNAVAQYENSLDQFKIALGLPVTEKIYLDDSLLRELERTGPIPLELDPSQAFKVAVAKQLPTLNAIDQFEDAKRKVRVAADRLRADINILADASLQSEGPTDYTKFDPDDIRAGVGVQLNLPFDRLRERNSYRATLITFESQIRNLGLTFDTMKENIDRGLRTLELRRQTFEIQRNALELANRRVESATLLLQAGRAEVRDLVEAQDAQISAQNAVTAALVGYQDQRLLLLLQLGVIETESSKFWLKDHLTPELRLNSGPMQTATADRIIPPDELFTK